MDGFIGEVIAFAGDFVPQGWLPCDGRTIPSDDPSALGFYIGTKYGNGSEVRVPALPPLTAKDGKTFNYIVCNSGRQLSAYLPYVLADIRHFAVDDDNLSQPYFDWFNTSGGAVDAINFQQLAFVLNNRFNPSGSFKPLILPSVPPLPSTTGSGTVATKICHNGAQPQYGPGSSPADQPYLAQIALFGGEQIPSGWLPCDGRELATAQHRDLFNILGFGFAARTVAAQSPQGDFALPPRFSLPDITPVSAGNNIGLPHIICVKGLLPKAAS